MRISLPIVAALAAAGALAAACKDGGPLQPRDRQPHAPRMYSSPTTSVKVACPPKAQKGQTVQCVAWGLDTYGVFTSGTVSGWSTSSGNFSVNSSGQVTINQGVTDTVAATVGGVTGKTTIAGRDSAAISVDVFTGVVPPSTTCTWTATASHGAAPYTFSWSASSPASGSASGDHWTGSSSSSFTFTVTATDADGRTGTNTFSVPVVPGGSCPPV
jgi:hypothetical protein